MGKSLGKSLRLNGEHTPPAPPRALDPLLLSGDSTLAQRTLLALDLRASRGRRCCLAALPYVRENGGMQWREVQYARSGDVNIAYQVMGEGSLDLVLVSGFVSHLELDWEEPRSAHFLERLASFSRLIRFDKRGTGLSDRPGGLPGATRQMTIPRQPRGKSASATPRRSNRPGAGRPT